MKMSDKRPKANCGSYGPPPSVDAGAVLSLRAQSVPAPSGSYDPQSPTGAQYEAFSSVFDHFNRLLFDGSLPRVMLVFTGRGRSLGHYAPEKWASLSDQEQVGEIALNPDHLRTRTPVQTASTIVHEMVHLWQHVHGTPSRRGYHNKEWSDRMEAIGLMPSDTGSPGGRRVGQRMTHYIIEGGPFDRAFRDLPTGVLLPFTAGSAKVATRKGSAGSRLKAKFTCPSCNANAWGKPSVRLVCGDCSVPLAPQHESSPMSSEPAGGAVQTAGCAPQEPESVDAIRKKEVDGRTPEASTAELRVPRAGCRTDGQTKPFSRPNPVRHDRPPMVDAMRTVMADRVMTAAEVHAALVAKRWMPDSRGPVEYIAYMLRNDRLFEHCAADRYRVRAGVKRREVRTRLRRKEATAVPSGQSKVNAKSVPFVEEP